MKRRTVLGALATLQSGASFRRASAASQAATLAAAEFTDERNATYRLSELTRPLVLVNLWASWCAGCLVELPTIQALASRLGPDTMDVVLLSHEMNWRGDLAYAREARLPFRHWKLSSRATETTAAAAFRIEDERFGLPQSLVFAGRKQMLVASPQGSQDWASPAQLRLARGWLDTAG